MIDELLYFLDNQAPAIVRRLSTQGGGTFDIQPGMTFRIKARPLHGDSLVIDQPMIPDVDADTLTYQPSSGDFDEQGVFKAWVSVDIAGRSQDTDEFTLNVFDHAPGRGTSTGAIYRACYAMVPVVWASVRGMKDYGDVELQRLIDLAKLRILRHPVTVVDEASLDPRVVDYIAKKVLVDHVLETAIDFWRNQIITRTARGNSEEIETYPDRIRAVEQQIKRFIEDLENQRPELEEIIGTPTGPTSLAPALDRTAPLLTPGLETMSPMYPSCPPGYFEEGW